MTEGVGLLLAQFIVQEGLEMVNDPLTVQGRTRTGGALAFGHAHARSCIMVNGS